MLENISKSIKRNKLVLPESVCKFRKSKLHNITEVNNEKI